MEKIFIVSMPRLGMVIMALFFAVVVYFLELSFQIKHKIFDVNSTVLTTLFIVPLIVVSFLGVAFFIKRIEKCKKFFTDYKKEETIMSF